MRGQALAMEGFGSEIEFLQSSPGPSAYDAFQCQFPGCNARYRRKEHLNRHEGSKHTKQQVFVCSSCDREFRRRYPSASTHSPTTSTLTLERLKKKKFSDTLRRHIQKQHKTTEPLNRARRACAGCHAGKIRCEGGVPCEECVRRNIQCSFQGHDASTSAEEQQTRSSTAPSSSLNDELSESYDWKRKKCVGRYFEIFHPRWPFIHRGSFNVRQEPPLLLLSVMAIGMWTSGEQSAQSAAVELHDKLDVAIRDQRVCQITNL